MNDNQILNKVSNKLRELIKDIDYTLSSEDIGDKIQNICFYIQQLSRNDYLIREIKNQIELASTSIIGFLSDKSKINLKNLLCEIHAFVKAYEIIVDVKEQNHVDESILELYEPYVDIDSGDVISELNTHVKDEIYSILNDKFYNENAKLDYLLLEASHAFEKSIVEIKKYSHIYYANMRQKLSEDIEGYSTKKSAQDKELKRQNRSSQFFFDPVKNTHSAVPQLSEKMFANRTLNSVSHEAPKLIGISSRHVITAATSAVKQATTYYHPKMPPNNTRESINMGATVIHWQNKPSQNNQGNLKIAGLGRYGCFNSKGKYVPSAILSSIDEINNWITEEKLAGYMIRYSKTGITPSLEDLQMKSTDKNKLLINKLNRILFLTSCAEIWRYMYTSKADENLSKDVPHITRIAFANAHARVLKLLSEGKLTMYQVFNEDADFGLPTGSRITAKENLPKIINKFISLNDLFNEEEVVEYNQNAIKFIERFPEGGISSFTDSHIYELSDTYDLEGKYEDCESSDEESNYLSI